MKIIAHLKRSWTRHFWTQTATLTVLVASFTVFDLFLLTTLNFRRILAEWSKEAQITAYLHDTVKSEHVAAIERKIKAINHVERVEFISPLDAAVRFREQLAGYAPDLLKDSGLESSLPASFAVNLDSLTSGTARLDILMQVAKTIGGFAEVEEVSYGQGWIENYSQFLASLGSIAWIICSILIAGSLFVVGNAIRASVSQRRDEIEVLELIGATPAMIRRPYLVEGAGMGLLAMLMSLALNYALFVGQLRVFSTSWSFMGLASHLRYLGPLTCLALAALGALLGAMGSYLAVRKLNDGWSASRRVVQ